MIYHISMISCNMKTKGKRWLQTAYKSIATVHIPIIHPSLCHPLTLSFQCIMQPSTDSESTSCIINHQHHHQKQHTSHGGILPHTVRHTSFMINSTQSRRTQLLHCCLSRSSSIQNTHLIGMYCHIQHL